MKFVVENVSKCAPRIGALKDFVHHPSYSLETPAAMLYTKGGAIPHITHELFRIISRTPQILQIPLVSTYQYSDVLADYAGTLGEFIGFQDCVTCMTVQDPGNLTVSGHHHKGAVPMWTRKGKVMLSADHYMDIIECYKPDIYFFLSDGDTNVQSSSKRISKSVENTKEFFKRCLDRHNNCAELKDSFPLGAIVGGYCMKARKESIDSVINSDVMKGFLIDGLHNNGPEIEFLPFEEARPIVEFTINNLPESKLRIIQGCWNPTVIMEFVKLGVDVFDTSYCNLVTERSSALAFSCDLGSYNEGQTYEINLRHSKYVDDFKPLLPNCECLTCQKHTRAYLHHLVTVQELLGPLLLMIHNNHHYMKFFEAIRMSIKNGSLNDLDRLIERQFTEHQDKMMTKKKGKKASEL